MNPLPRAVWFFLISLLILATLFILSGCAIPVAVEPRRTPQGEAIPIGVALTEPAPGQRVAGFAPASAAAVASPSPASDIFQTVLFAGLGMLGIGAPLLLRLRAAIRVASEAKIALTDAVRFGEDAAEADPSKPEQLEEIKRAHKTRQRQNGTLGIIRNVLGKKD